MNCDECKEMQKLDDVQIDCNECDQGILESIPDEY